MVSFRSSGEGFVEEPLVCEGPLGAIHARSYRPRANELDAAPLVLVPPDGEERDWAMRPFVTAARVLASGGRTVARFDYFGQGESAGDYEDASMCDRAGDVLAVTQALRRMTGRAPILIGARLGAVIAFLAARQNPDLEQLILWEPVFDTDQYLQQLLRVNVSTQMVTHGRVIKERPELIEDARAGQMVSVNGYRLSGAFIDELLELNVVPDIDRLGEPLLAVTIGALDRRVASHPRVTHVRIEGSPFWKEPKRHLTAPIPYVGATVAWLHTKSLLKEVS